MKNFTCPHEEWHFSLMLYVHIHVLTSFQNLFFKHFLKFKEAKEEWTFHSAIVNLHMLRKH